MRMCQKDVGCPGLIQGLKNLLGRGKGDRQVRVELRDGLSFIDEVVEVVSEQGVEVAVFKDNSRIEVTRIDAITVGAQA
jgi:Rho-binding antiterminator